MKQLLTWKMKKQRPSDINQRAKLIVDIATGEKDEPLKIKNPVAVERGKKRWSNQS